MVLQLISCAYFIVKKNIKGESGEVDFNGLCSKGRIIILMGILNNLKGILVRRKSMNNGLEERILENVIYRKSI